MIAYFRHADTNQMESMKNCEDAKLNFCPIETGIELLTGKWKARILWKLYQTPVMRFGELRRSLNGITEKMLAQQLRDLESAGLINRKLYGEVPPRVEYSLSEFGKSIEPIMDKFAEWGVSNKDKITELIESNSSTLRPVA